MIVAIAVLKTSSPIVVVDLAITILTFILLLLDKNSVQLNVAVVHNQILLHETFQAFSIDYIEGTMLTEATH